MTIAPGLQPLLRKYIIMNTSEVNYCHQHSRSLLLSNGWKYQILRLAGSVIHLGQHILIACIYSTSRLLENPFSGQILTFKVKPQF